MLVDAQEDIAATAAALRDVIAAESDESRRSEYELVVEDLSARKHEYDRLVERARTIISDLLRRRLIQGAALTPEYATAQAEIAAATLQSASDLFQSGLRAHAIQVFVSAQLNDVGGLHRSADVLGDAKLPISLYGYVVDPRRGTHQKYAKLEVDQEAVRFAVISQIKNANGKTKPASKAAGADSLGNFGELPGLRSAVFEGFTVAPTALRKLETRQASVYLELNDRKVKQRKLLFEPLHLCRPVPSEGPGARQFANQYTNVMARYSSIETAKLGKESMTIGEKLKVGYQIADLTMQIYIAVVNPIGAYEAFQKTRRLARTFRVSSMRVQRLALARQQFIEGLPYKVIPEGPVLLSFRGD